MAKIEEKKMTLEEYQKQYSKPQNTKSIKTFLFIITATIGIMVFCLLLLIASKIYELCDKNTYVGIACIVIGLLLFIALYLIPAIKIYNTKAFITNVDVSNVKKAQKYNKALREELADKFIDVVDKTDGVTWYDKEKIGTLAIARHTNNNTELKNVLTKIYEEDVKKASDKLIRDTAIQVGLSTAISQDEKIDALLVLALDLNLIKNIIFMYGFRPSDAKLLKIYETVLMDALLAYGIQSVSTSVLNTGIKAVGESFKNVPLIGAIGSIAGSAVQGVTNSALTVKIGYQTKKYLMNEYHLQNIIDVIELTPEEEAQAEAALLDDIENDLKTKNKKEKNSKLQAA